MRIVGDERRHHVDPAVRSVLEHDMKRDPDVRADGQVPHHQKTLVFDVAHHLAAEEHGMHDVVFGEALASRVPHGVTADAIATLAYQRDQLRQGAHAPSRAPLTTVHAAG